MSQRSIHSRRLIGRLLTAAALTVSCSGGDPSGPGSGGGGSADRAAAVQTIFGGTQTGDVARPLGEPLGALVSDEDGRSLAGVTVTWRATLGGGSFEPASTATDSFGFAQTIWTLGTAAGAARAEGVVGDLAPAVFTATARPGPVGSLRIDPFNRSVSRV